ncbi:manganese efflux pump [candidate division KSB1 bacterium]|nr:manganese efflux pump [candidate division KSB1 bacterium]
MKFIDIIFISLALAMDAFAVAVAAGACLTEITFRHKFRLAFHFGLFQFMMPILGWFAGSEIVNYVADYDHWIALIILAIIGLKMIYEAFKPDSEEITRDITRGLTLVSLSTATSIDALAVGFSIGIIKNDILVPSIIIGIVAAAMTLLGLKSGAFLSARFGRKITFVGGIILILIGIHIVLDHLALL